MEERVNTVLIQHRTGAADKTGLVNHCLVYCSQALSTTDLPGPWGVKDKDKTKSDCHQQLFFTLSSKTLLLMHTVHLLVSIFFASFPPILQGQSGVQEQMDFSNKSFPSKCIPLLPPAIITFHYLSQPCI